MRLIHKIKESPHYLRLKNSAQYRYDRRQFVIISIVFGIILLMFLPLMIWGGDTSGAGASLIMCIFCMMGYFFIWLYFLYHWLEIFLHIGSYLFCQVKLDQPHIEGRGGARFTVAFTDRRGKAIKRDTSAMFSSQWEPFLEDYNNQTALIGYNEETDRVVVIERVNV